MNLSDNNFMKLENLQDKLTAYEVNLQDKLTAYEVKLKGIKSQKLMRDFNDIQKGHLFEWPKVRNFNEHLRKEDRNPEQRGVVSIPFNINYAVYGAWTVGRALCKFCMVIDYTACAASVFNIVLISYDRHLSVTNPVAHRAQQASSTITKITAVWMFAFIVYGPALMFGDTITGQSQIPSDHCYAEFTYGWYFSACLLTCNFFIPFISVSYFNLDIYWNIRKRMKKREIKVINNMQFESKREEETCLSVIRIYILLLKEKLVCSSSVSKESIVNKCCQQTPSLQKMDKISSSLNNRHISSTADEQKIPSQISAVRLSKDKKIAKSLAVLVLIFGICQAPYTFVSIINSISWNDVGYYWSCITCWIMWLNSLINPVLYPLCHRSFRRAFSKIFCHK
ncbi:histamine H3 receptor-like [Protopterus annectens]|uniref:histamine H3 receptor-like n=1 Tax=Protopterus annectens TaxID=7888 RepID=UPI001CFA3084|nr:histamine H3 receptor-like [Protopterus annectens]